MAYFPFAKSTQAGLMRKPAGQLFVQFQHGCFKLRKFGMKILDGIGNVGNQRKAVLRILKVNHLVA
jgi:hypothetical protein